VEIYRSHDGRWVIERAVDRYLIYDTEISDEDEVWSTSTMAQLLTWLHENGLSVADFDEV
jgi:hypothetical protein